MVRVMKSALLWQLVGGFVLGLTGIVAFGPADASQTLVDRAASVVAAGR